MRAVLLGAALSLALAIPAFAEEDVVIEEPSNAGL